MDLIHRLPYVLSALMAIIAGLISDKLYPDTNSVYINMLIAMITFYFLGFLIRNVALSIFIELENKSIQQKLEEERRLKAQAMVKNSTADEESPSKLDLRVGADNDHEFYDEEFSPLKVATVIRKNLE